MGSPLPAGPYTFRPSGLYDSLEGESAIPGACFVLQNLIHDTTTPFVWNGRPGVVSRTTFGGFANPGAISVALAVGTRVYGLIATSRNGGFDEPFCFDNASGTFIAVGSVTSANVPTTQALTGPWTPPTMDVIGSKIIVTHPGFSGSNFFGYFDIASPASPTWAAGNTGSNGLPSVPIAVKMFNNRAYFACGYLLYYSDSLAPTTITASSQFLTVGGAGSNITGLGGIPITQTTSGILSALIVFKAGAYGQVTGDASGTLVFNYPLGGGVGCSAARSIVQTPAGLAFLAFDGMRMIDLSGALSPNALPGVRNPFQSAYTPSRVCAGYNNTVLRVALQTVTNPITNANAFVEYWFDFEIQNWSGPHTWASDVMVPMDGTFLVTSNRAQGVIYQSDTTLTTTTRTVELGQTLQYNIQSTLLPHDTGMAMKAVVEAQVSIDFGAVSSTATVQMLSAAMGAVGSATVTSINGTYWGQFNWLQANWSGAIYGLRTYNIDWTTPVVYKTAAIAMTGVLTTGLRIGSFRVRVEELEYMNEQV